MLEHHDGPKATPSLPRRNDHDLSLTPPARAAHEITAEDRMGQPGDLTPAQQAEALLWLSGYAPATFDAVIDAVQPLPGDGSDDPVPFCERSGRRRPTPPPYRGFQIL